MLKEGVGLPACTFANLKRCEAEPDAVLVNSPSILYSQAPHPSLGLKPFGPERAPYETRLPSISAKIAKFA